MLLDVPCKAGKLQVLEEGIIRVQKLFSDTDWQVSCDAVAKFASQPVSFALTVLVYTSQGIFIVEILTKANFERLQLLFPAKPVQNHERAVSWRQDVTKQTYVATYANQQVMQKGVERAAQYGWVPQTTVAALAGGTSHSRDRLTITYVRTPEWLAQNG